MQMFNLRIQHAEKVGRLPLKLLLAGIAGGLSQALPAGELQPLLEDWQFHLGEINSTPPYSVDDGDWQPVQLPHDWSIRLPRAADNPSEGGGGFFQTGQGIYQKTFRLPQEWKGKRILLHFEGIARESQVFLNGKHLGGHLNPYTPVRFDLTDHLEAEDDNVLTVEVDNSGEPSSRWYTGSGIYRPVWLEAVGAVHVPFGGLAVRTRTLSGSRAVLEIEGSLRNSSDKPVEAKLDLAIYDPAGRLAGRTGTILVAGAGQDSTTLLELELDDVRAWSPDNPALYRADASIFSGTHLLEQSSCRFGIRTLETSTGRGLVLNGEPVELLGCNVHHDYGPLGAAVFPSAARRRARIIKEAGFNAVRTAHNPPSTAFLNACDEVGLLVMDEAFDTWKVAKVNFDYHRHFEENWREDLRTLILRDRNHPSVILWSTGNEMYDRGKDYAPELSRQMVELVRSLDPSRPVTAGINGLAKPEDWPKLDPLYATLDVAGYNYELHRYREDHERVPDRIIYASESYLTEVFENWKIIHEAGFVFGEFIWSGLDYLGEAAIGRVFPPGEEARKHWEGSHWPWHGAACGDIDLLGHRRPVSHYRNIVWDKGETLYMAVEIPVPGGGEWQLTPWSAPPFQASWTWPGHEGETMSVEVYSRFEQVRLYLNGDLVGEAGTSEETGFKAVFEVPYQPGSLMVEGLTDGRTEEKMSLKTAGNPAGFWLSPSVQVHRADPQEVIYVDVRIIDAEKLDHPSASLPVTYTLSGPATLLAVGSADLASEEAYTANPRRTFQGRAQVVIRPTGENGDIVLAASAPGLQDATITLRQK